MSSNLVHAKYQKKRAPLVPQKKMLSPSYTKYSPTDKFLIENGFNLDGTPIKKKDTLSPGRYQLSKAAKLQRKTELLLADKKNIAAVKKKYDPYV